MDNKFLNLNLKDFEKIKEKLYKEAKKYGNYFVSVPAGLISFLGYQFPDRDISLFGIGTHRFFLFHSAIGLYVLKKFYEKYINEVENKDTITGKILGASLIAGAVGVGIHLMVDIVQPKTIAFPFFGSLVDGTMIDDRLWLLGNSLWCFKIAKDTYVLTFGNEFDVKKLVKSIYSSETVYKIKEFIKKNNLTPVIGGVILGSIIEEIIEGFVPGIKELGLLGEIMGGISGWYSREKIKQIKESRITI